MSKRMKRRDADRKMEEYYGRMVSIIKAIENSRVPIRLVAGCYHSVRRDALEALETLGGKWKHADGMAAWICEVDGRTGIEWAGYEITLFTRILGRREDVAKRFTELYQLTIDDVGMTIGRPTSSIGVG